MPQIEQSSIKNRLLAALPADDFARVRTKLRPANLSIKQVLFGPDQPIETVYFVQTGIVSLLAPLEDGARLEVAVIGCEGVSGLECVMGANTSNLEAMIQLEGTALTMSAGEAQDAFDQNDGFRRTVLRFAQAQQSLIAQTAACNGRHELEARLAKWLLLVHDRIKDDHVLMTHEFMALMLGVRRSGVTLAVGALRKAGLIQHGNGYVDVVDRNGLEGAACECYEVVRTQYERLLRS
jgi:CRP-like cAMP-binding protein